MPTPEHARQAARRHFAFESLARNGFDFDRIAFTEDTPAAERLDITAQLRAEVGRYSTEQKEQAERIVAWLDANRARQPQRTQLQAYSPDLAVSNANADVTRMLDDIREGQALGPEMARLTDLQTQANSDFREVMLPWKQFLDNVLIKVMETLFEWMPRIAATSAATLEATKEELKLITSLPAALKAMAFPVLVADEIGKKVRAAYDEALENFRQRNKLNPANALIQGQFDALNRAAAGVDRGARNLPPLAGRLNIPAFGGGA